MQQVTLQDSLNLDGGLIDVVVSRIFYFCVERLDGAYQHNMNALCCLLKLKKVTPL